MTTPMAPTVWHRLEALLARLRPHREPLSLAADALVVAACWNITYLFRLGFERWIAARPAYDGWVLLGVVALYLLAFAMFRVPQSMWRFAGFGEVKRLTLACLLAGTVAAARTAGSFTRSSGPSTGTPAMRECAFAGSSSSRPNTIHPCW